jgi:hypothetical protein
VAYAAKRLPLLTGGGRFKSLEKFKNSESGEACRLRCARWRSG